MGAPKVELLLLRLLLLASKLLNKPFKVRKSRIKRLLFIGKCHVQLVAVRARIRITYTYVAGLAGRQAGKQTAANVTRARVANGAA